MANKKNTKLNFPRVITMSLAMIPVLAFFAIVVNLVWQSIPAITDVGLIKLFSLKFSTVFSAGPGEYGLTPALWNTFLLVMEVLLIAFPVSMAMAIFASEFSLGGFGRIIELILSLFSGIPPVLYGLLSVFVLTTFIHPKFAAVNLDQSVAREMLGVPGGNLTAVLPFFESTFLGGLMISLLVIPFMAPIILDAFRSVPSNLKEGSLALGASHWYTLWHSTIPSALSGIATAVSLTVLKTMGELVIAVMTIGYLADRLPNPLIDVFEQGAPLTATMAALLSGGLRPNSGPRNTLDGPVAYFGGLLLLVVALLVLILISYIQKSIRKRFGNEH